VPLPFIRSYTLTTHDAFEISLAAAAEAGFEPTMVDPSTLHMWLKGPKQRQRISLSITDNGMGGVTIHVTPEIERRFGGGGPTRRFIRSFERVLRRTSQ